MNGKRRTEGSCYISPEHLVIVTGNGILGIPPSTGRPGISRQIQREASGRIDGGQWDVYLFDMCAVCR